MKRVFIIIAMLMLIIQFGCTKAGFKESVIFESNNDHVVLVHETDKAGEVVPKGYNHPATFTPGQIDKILQQIFYAEYMFFKYRGHKTLFIEIERQKLSTYISEALEKATQNNWIKFAVTAKKRDMLLPTRRLTTGYIFIEDNMFNIVIGNLNFELSDEDRPFSGDPRSRFSIPTLSLKEADGITFPAVDKSVKLRKRPHNNWLVMDTAKILGSLETEVSPVVKTTTPAVIDKPDEKTELVESDETLEDKTIEPPKEKTLEQRLTELKTLYEKGLISEEDYERRKQELLKEL